MRKRALLFFVSILFVICVPFTVVAVEQCDDCSLIYEDVKLDDWYYKPIMQLYEDGYLLEKEGDLFRPDENVKTYEVLWLLDRVFQEDSKVPSDISKIKDYPYHLLSWVDKYKFMGVYDIDITRRNVCSYLFDCIDCVLLNPKYHSTGDMVFSEFDSSIYTAYVYGFIKGYSNGDLGSLNLMTRAEFCTLVYNVKYREKDCTIPDFNNDILITPTFYNVREQSAYDCNCCLSDVPAWLSNFFNKNGNKFIFCDTQNNMKYLWYSYTTSEFSDFVGAYMSYNKDIIVMHRENNYRTLETIYHELGHAVYDKCIEEGIIYELYEREQVELTNLIRDSYCKKSQNEYFSEAFSFIMQNRENERCISEMKEKIPYTFEYISKIIDELSIKYE